MIDKSTLQTESILGRPSKGPQLRANPKRGGVYYIYYSIPGAQRSRHHSTGTSDQKEAVEYFGRWLAHTADTVNLARRARKESEQPIIDDPKTLRALKRIDQMFGRMFDALAELKDGNFSPAAAQYIQLRLLRTTQFLGEVAAYIEKQNQWEQR